MTGFIFRTGEPAGLPPTLEREDPLAIGSEVARAPEVVLAAGVEGGVRVGGNVMGVAVGWGVGVGCGVAVGGNTGGVGVGNGVGKITAAIAVGVGGNTMVVAVGAGVTVGIDANADEISSWTSRRTSSSDGTHAARVRKIPAAHANITPGFIFTPGNH